MKKIRLLCYDIYLSLLAGFTVMFFYFAIWKNDRIMEWLHHAATLCHMISIHILGVKR